MLNRAQTGVYIASAAVTDAPNRKGPPYASGHWGQIQRCAAAPRARRSPRARAQQHALAQGRLEYRGRRVDPAAITRTSLLTVEGERDDICGAGQTAAAHDLCTSLPAFRRRHHLQPGAGHFGVFSGSRWELDVYPLIRSLILMSR